MDAKNFQIEIATPQDHRNFDQVSSCSAPGVQGRFQILFNHAPFISLLDVGELRIDTPEEVRHFAISGGFIQVLNNKILFLLDSIESVEEIDIQRAEAALGRAENRIDSREQDIDIPRAKLAYARALNRLNIAKKFSA